jgi:hypothetical protein
MAGHTRETQKTNDRADQEHRVRQQESQQLFDKSLAWDQGLLSLTETPFYPRMDEQAALLSRISSAVQRHQFAMQLQKTYGNQHIQRLVESLEAQSKLLVNNSNDVYEQEADTVAEAVTRTITSPVQQPLEEEEEEMPAQTIGQPETAWQKLQEEKLQVQPALTPPTLDNYPDPTRDGGMVVVRSNAWAIWINSDAAYVPDCIREGVRLHEQKHIDDFSADADYRSFPTTGGASDGQTFFYGSSADARRFETAAVGVESNWIRGQLGREDLTAEDRRILQTRVNQDLPNYLAGL